MSRHIVTSFDEDLSQLDGMLRDMDAMAGQMVREATAALLGNDNDRALQVIASDRDLDLKQRELDDLAIMLIAKRQPMAQDLRTIVGSIRMAADLERIGDLAKNVAKRVEVVQQSRAPGSITHSIETMSDLVIRQVDAVIEHYIAGDAEALIKLRIDDEKIDVHYTSIFRELLTYMMEDPRNITPCTHLLFCAKNLERVGDHVTNIAENAYYILTGSQLSVQRPKQDEMDLTKGNL